MNHSLWLNTGQMFSSYYQEMHQSTLSQLALVPVALLYQRLVVTRRISIRLRYLLLLAGGLTVLLATFGAAASLVLLSSATSLVLTCCVPPAILFRCTLAVQIVWQLLCGTMAERSLLMPSLMMLTQRVTSLALDVQEGRPLRYGFRPGEQGCPALLPHLAYLLYFPAILGGPHCSFSDFVEYVEDADSDGHRDLNPSHCVCTKLLAFFPMDVLRGWLLVHCLAQWEPGFRDKHEFVGRTTFLQRMWLLWETALAIKLCYYTQWLLGEALTIATGLGYRRNARAVAGPRALHCAAGGVATARGEAVTRERERKKAARLEGDGANAERAAAGAAGGGSDGGQWDELWDLDALALEGACHMSTLARTWNRTAALWLRRVAFTRSPCHPLAATFAFSALWHGLHPGHCLAMAVWGLGVEADHRVRGVLSPVWHRSRLGRAAAWLWTQIAFAYILVLVEFREERGGLALVTCSTHALVPLICLLAVLLLPRRPTGSDDASR